MGTLSQFTFIKSTKELNKYFLKDGTKIGRGQMYSGEYIKIQVPSIQELFDGFDKFKNNHAITLGVPKVEKGEITVADKVKDSSIARTKEFFSFSSTAFLLLDYDPSENGYTVESPEHYARILRDIDPELIACDIGVRYGSSYGIMKDGVLISDKKSMHAYIIVTNATDEKVIQYRDYLVSSAWAKGYGHIELSKVGSIMKRQVFDSAVFSPERLVFEAAPTLETGITKLKTENYIFKGKK